MAGDANSPRLSAARLLSVEIDGLKLTCGILLKATRSYKRPSKPDGLRQTDAAIKKYVTQTGMSNLELGKTIPNDPELKGVLAAIGFDLRGTAGLAVLSLLQCLRDHADGIAALERCEPI